MSGFGDEKHPLSMRDGRAQVANHMPWRDSLAGRCMQPGGRRESESVREHIFLRIPQRVSQKGANATFVVPTQQRMLSRLTRSVTSLQKLSLTNRKETQRLLAQTGRKAVSLSAWQKRRRRF
jgi:hypothetical protein